MALPVRRPARLSIQSLVLSSSLGCLDRISCQSAVGGNPAASAVTAETDYRPIRTRCRAVLSAASRSQTIARSAERSTGSPASASSNCCNGQRCTVP